MDWVKGLWGTPKPVSQVPMSEPIELEVEHNMVSERDQSLERTSDCLRHCRESSADEDDLVADMNDLAGKMDSSAITLGGIVKTTGILMAQEPLRRSPRKRKSDEEMWPDESPSKKLRQAAQSTPASQPEDARLIQSTGLRMSTRKPVATQQRKDKNSFEMPDDVLEAETQRTTKLAQPLRRVKLLKKEPPTANLSPLRKAGTVRTSLAPGVNLEDSPSKHTRARAQTRLPVVQNVDEAERLMPSPKVAVGKAAKAQKRKAHVEGSNLQDTSQEVQAAEIDSEARRNAASRSRHKSGGREPSGDERHSDNDPRLEGQSAHEASEDEVASTTDAESDSQRRVNGAQKKRNEREARDERRKTYRQVALDGIEQIADLHGCSRLWRHLLAATEELDVSRNDVKPVSLKGKTLCADIHQLQRLYKRANSAAANPNIVTRDHFDEIAEIGVQICMFDRTETNGIPQRKKKARDLYGHIVPSICRALGIFLIRFEGVEIVDPDVYEEICALLKVAVDAAEEACEWKPRPSTLDAGVLLVMRNDVRSNLTELHKRFDNVRENGVARVREKEQLDSLAESQKRDQERLQLERQRRLTWLTNASQQQPELSSQRATLEPEPVLTPESESDRESFDEKELLNAFEKRQKREQVKILEDRQRRYASIIGSRHHRIQAIATTGVAAAVQKDVFDIDDIDLGIPSPPSSTGAPSAVDLRPSLRRAQTEEIPGPVFPAWTTEESLKFTRILEIYTKPSRFEEIFQQYGGPHGYLARHNVESLRKQGTFIRQSMASQLPALGPEWNWLRSIPI